MLTILPDFLNNFFTNSSVHLRKFLKKSKMCQRKHQLQTIYYWKVVLYVKIGALSYKIKSVHLQNNNKNIYYFKTNILIASLRI